MWKRTHCDNRIGGGQFMEIGKISLASSFAPLEEGFRWAKDQALSFIHDGDDPVGLWYEAALPHREAFCLRDVAHQCNGAFFLGLREFNKNMLRKFAQNIKEEMDFCTYWEINKDDLPAPVDYKSDDDFWYNLPGSFDFIDCCLRQYNWTGDLDYVHGEEFKRFYHLTMNDYIERWDKDRDGIPEKQGAIHYRGIPSYMESHVEENGIYVGSDLIGAMFAAYKAYSAILSMQGNDSESKKMEQHSLALQEMFERDWWSENGGMFYSSILQDGTKSIVNIDNINDTSSELTPMPLYFNIIKNPKRKCQFLHLLNECKTLNVETLSILPEVFYSCGEGELGFNLLMKLMDPSLIRRDYPEVSFSAVGATITGLVGLSADAQGRKVVLQPHLPKEVDWVVVDNIPLFNGSINVKIHNHEITVESNCVDPFSLELIAHNQVKKIKVEAGHVYTVTL